MLDVTNQISKYDKAEQQGRSLIPNRAIQAFGLDVFSAAGYPYRIAQASELWRYHDVMHHGRFERNLALIGEDLDTGLLSTAKSAVNVLVSFSRSRFGFESAAKDMMSRAIYQFKLLSAALSGEPRPWTVMEVGPGSGYLGLLLGLDGHKYIALEASQAFFIYQSTLYSDVFGDAYSDGLDGDSGAQISHMPWWSFCAEASCIPHLTAVTANHMLAEMNKLGVSFLFEKLQRSQREGFTVFAESLGARTINSVDSVTQNIANQGFDVVEDSDDLWRFKRTTMQPQVLRYQPDRAVAIRRKLLRIYVGLGTIPYIGHLVRLAPRTVRRLLGKPRRNSSSSTAESPTSTTREIFRPYVNFESAEFRFENNRW